jgi:hypothetical protein
MQSVPVNTQLKIPDNPRVKARTFGIELTPQDLKNYMLAEGIHGYKAYLNIVDRKSRYMWIFLSKDKEPPLQFLDLWFKQHGIGTRGINGCILRTDGGGELAGSHALRKLCDKHNYLIETTGTDASSQNGLSERPHRHAGKIIRALLDNANLPYTYWPYALIHWALIWNMTYHRSIDSIPYYILTGIMPNLNRLRVFGCKVYAKQRGDRATTIANHFQEGIFVGYTATMDNIIYIDIKTARESRAKHVIFDESNFDRYPMPPGARRLARKTGRLTPEEFTSGAEPPPISSIIMIPNAYLERIEVTMNATQTQQHGFKFEEDAQHNHMYVVEVTDCSIARSLLNRYKRLCHAWLISVNGINIHNKEELAATLKDITKQDPLPTYQWVFAPDRTVKRHKPTDDIPMLAMDQLVGLQRLINKVKQGNKDGSIIPTESKPSPN